MLLRVKHGAVSTGGAGFTTTQRVRCGRAVFPVALPFYIRHGSTPFYCGTVSDKPPQPSRTSGDQKRIAHSLRSGETGKTAERTAPVRGGAHSASLTTTQRLRVGVVFCCRVSNWARRFTLVGFRYLCRRSMLFRTCQRTFSHWPSRQWPSPRTLGQAHALNEATFFRAHG